MEEIKIAIQNGSEQIILPVVPENYDVSDNWSNQELNINQLGLINMVGKRGLKSVTISSFFPSKEYEFVTPGGDTADYDPWAMVKRLLDWRGEILTFSISGTGENIVSWPCLIDGDFSYGEKDASGDVYYSITFKEYKRTNTTRTVTTPKKKWPFPYTTKKGDTINSICKKQLGNTKRKNDLYNSNKKVLKKAFKAYMKKLSKKQQKTYKKKSKYNKAMLKGVKLILSEKSTSSTAQTITPVGSGYESVSRG